MKTSKVIRKRKPKSYGFIPSFPEEGDYILGGTTKLGSKVIVEDGQWDNHLPVEEYQRLGVETQGCVSWGTLSAVEILIKRLTGIEYNWSDRYLAWNSDTTERGNTPTNVCEYLRKAGVPFQHKWDNTKELNTWAKFYETPPAKLVDDARTDFLAKFSFKHEFVPPHPEMIKEALQYSPLGFSVFAWVKKDGVHYRPKGAIDNHYAVCYGWVERDGKTVWKIFDSYDNVKKLYEGTPMIVKRFEIGDPRKKMNWLQKILAVFEAIGRWVSDGK